MLADHDGKWIAPLLWLGLGTAAGMLLAVAARAEQLTASPVHLAFCALYSRESVRIDLMHSRPVGTVTDKYIESLAVQVFHQCMSILPTLLPLPEAHRNLDTWVADMRTLLVSRAGTEPAMGGDDEWRDQCQRQYRTWDEATGTVIRAGSPARVRCPCGEGVTCE
jgi:hypothetical protein